MKQGNRLRYPDTSCAPSIQRLKGLSELGVVFDSLLGILSGIVLVMDYQSGEDAVIDLNASVECIHVRRENGWSEEGLKGD
jgi:hypothetical protein